MEAAGPAGGGGRPAMAFGGERRGYGGWAPLAPGLSQAPGVCPFPPAELFLLLQCPSVLQASAPLPGRHSFAQCVVSVSATPGAVSHCYDLCFQGLINFHQATESWRLGCGGVTRALAILPLRIFLKKGCWKGSSFFSLMSIHC